MDRGEMVPIVPGCRSGRHGARLQAMRRVSRHRFLASRFLISVFLVGGGPASAQTPLGEVPGATQLQATTGAGVQAVCGRMSQQVQQLGGQSLDLFFRCRELVRTAGDSDEFNLGLTNTQLNGALQQVATEEAAALGSRGGEIASGRIGAAIGRLSEIRRGATGFRVSFVNPEGAPLLAQEGLSVGGLATGGGAQASGGGAFLEEGRLSGFLNVAYGFGDKDGTDREDGYDFSSWTATGGVDYRINDRFTVGGMLSYGTLDADFDTTPYTVAGGGADSDVWGLTLYGLFTEGPLYADALVGYGWTSYDIDRQVLYVPGSDATVTDTSPRRFNGEADTDGYDFVASLGLGYDVDRGALSFGPYARLTYYESDIDGYSEGGTGATELAMKVDDQSVESFTSSIGARLSYAISQSFGVIIPQVRAEWVHEYSNDARDITATYVFDPNQLPLVARTNDPDRDYGYIGVGISSVLPQGRQLFLDYQGLVGYRDLEDHRIVAGLRLEF